MTSNSSTITSNSFGIVPTTKDIALITTGTSKSLPMVHISQLELDMLLCSQSIMTSPHATHASLSGNDTYIAFSN